MLPPVHPLAEQWLAGLADADLVVNRDDVQDEAQGNLWWFGLTREQAGSVTVDHIVAFMEAVTDLRRAQVVAAEAPPMVLGWWHDAPTAQLRCSVVSAAHGTLPVGDAYQPAEAPEDVVREWLASPQLSGLPWSDVETVEPKGEAGWESSEVAHPVALPTTWIVALP